MRAPYLLTFLLASPLAACGFSVTGGVSIDGAIADGSGSGSDSAMGSDGMGSGGMDAGIDTVAATHCYGAYHEVCLVTEPTGAYALAADKTIDTGGNSDCLPTVGGTNGVCVLAGTSVSIAAGVTLRVHGDQRALVIVATGTLGTIVVDGTIDVGTGLGTNQGAGNALGTCNAGTAPSVNGGGQGGSFGGIGGDGGDDGYGMHGAIVTLAAHELRGGCDGAKGGGAGASGGDPGGGGGAVLLSAKASIAINGTVDASGAGGGRGAGGKGGGGAGSGGFIGLEAPAITIAASGALWANGGGGGEGDNGENGDNAEALVPANGGDGAGNGGDGGDGSQGGVGEDGKDGNNNGGGGGGGAGYIKASVSPVVVVPSRVSPAIGTLPQ